MSSAKKPVTTLKSTWSLEEQLTNEEQLNRYRTECELLREKVSRLEQEKNFLVDWEKRANEKCQKLVDELENERAARSKLTFELNQRIDELVNEKEKEKGKVKAVKTVKACNQSKLNKVSGRPGPSQAVYVSESDEGDLGCASNSYEEEEEMACEPPGGDGDRNTEIILNVARNVLSPDDYRSPGPEISNLELTNKQFSSGAHTGRDLTGYGNGDELDDAEQRERSRRWPELKEYDEREQRERSRRWPELKEYDDREQREQRSRRWPELKEYGTYGNLEMSEKQFSPVSLSPRAVDLTGNGSGQLGKKDMDSNENPNDNIPDDEAFTASKRRKKRRGPAELLQDLRKRVENSADVGGKKQSSNLELTEKQFSPGAQAGCNLTGNASGLSGKKDHLNEKPSDSVLEDEDLTISDNDLNDEDFTISRPPKRARGPSKLLQYLHDGLAGENLGEEKQTRLEGVLTRSMIPINYKNWKAVPKELKQQLWEKIKECCHKPESLRKKTLVDCSEKWRCFKSNIYSTNVQPYKKEGQLEKLKVVPEKYKKMISQEAWDDFVAQRLTPEWEVLSSKQKSTRNKSTRNLRSSCK